MPDYQKIAQILVLGQKIGHDARQRSVSGRKGGGGEDSVGGQNWI